MKFLGLLSECCIKSKKVKENPDKDLCEFLSVLYEQENIKKMAEQDFEFKVPKFVKLIDL